MKIAFFQCNSCGGEHPPQSDLIYGYTMRKMNLFHDLKYVKKDASDRHICLDCLNAFKRVGNPDALSLDLEKDEVDNIRKEFREKFTK
jgi:hypothetical protein